VISDLNGAPKGFDGGLFKRLGVSEFDEATEKIRAVLVHAEALCTAKRDADFYIA
jgi:hypothetical protein